MITWSVLGRQTSHQKKLRSIGNEGRKVYVIDTVNLLIKESPLLCNLTQREIQTFGHFIPETLVGLSWGNILFIGPVSSLQRRFCSMFVAGPQAHGTNDDY